MHEQRHDHRADVSRSTTFTDEEARLLVKSGDYESVNALREAEKNAAEKYARAVEKTALALLAATRSPEEVAEGLGIEPSGVSHRENEQQLYGFSVGGTRYYPLWQFINEGRAVLPNIRPVLQAIPARMHPASVSGFMTSPKASLVLMLDTDGEARAVSPVEWLSHGGAPGAVVELLENRHRS